MTDLASIGIVDLMIGFPSAEASRHYEGIRALTKDAASQDMEFPAEYMFKGVPNQAEDGRDPVETTLEAMDKHGIAIGMVSLGNESTTRALELHPDRFAPSLEIDPNDIGGAVKRVRESHQRHHIKAVTTFPAGCNPQVPVSDRRYYPIYQTCVDLDIPIVANAGIAGPGSLRHARTSCTSTRSATTSPTYGSSCGTGPSRGRTWLSSSCSSGLDSTT
jgi:predicted TIM-barrel fold metal-dependent hydrolase